MARLYKASESGHLQVVGLPLSEDEEVYSRVRVSAYSVVMFCVIIIICDRILENRPRCHA